MKTVAAIGIIAFLISFIGYFVLLIKKGKIQEGNIFTNDGCFLLHIIFIFTIATTIANFLFWPWGQYFLGGQILCIAIGGTVAITLGWLREKFGKTGYSKSDMKANWIGFALFVIANIAIFNFGHGV